MRMRRPVPLALGFALLVSTALAAIPFPHEHSDLKMDPAVTHGTLPHENP